ncbi:MAG: SDR family oxidoreductase [Polyangiaceae bacterium]|nr:SDR family oxidoreductase [Polyangiaceae bacterium]
MSGKVCLVTGANTGIGAVTARELAHAGAHVVLACRKKERAEPVLAEIAADGGKADFLQLDLADLASVRSAAEGFLARDLPLHVLVNNAGLAGQRGITKDGFELAFGVNHLGHFLFTLLLLDKLKESAPARIVIVSSGNHYKAAGFDWEAVRKSTASVTGLPEYSASKLANVLFAKELTRRLPADVTTYSLHPGVVASDVWRGVPWPFRSIMKLFMVSNEEGAQTSLYCATSPELAGESGKYYDRCREKRPNRVAGDEALARELWDKSVAWTSAP